MPNIVNVRTQTAEDRSVLWQQAWADLCPALGGDGGALQTTGWQEAVVRFTAPETGAPDEERVVFTINGYNSTLFTLHLDQVQLFAVD